MRRLLVLVFLVLCGCDDDFYYSSVPISNNKHSSIDSSLIGYWEHAGHEYGGLDLHMKILPINEKEIIIDIVVGAVDPEYSEEDLEFSAENPVFPCGEIWYTYIGHTSKIDSRYYYNLKNLDRELEGNKNLYCFFTFTLERDTLFTNFLNSDFEMKPASSREFRKYILKNQEEFDSLFINGYEFTSL